MKDTVTLSHGSGGRLTWELISNIFIRHFGAQTVGANDAAEVTLAGNEIAFTTDSFVVNPIFFPGGNIGKLAICGTVNDLVCGGAIPVYLSCGFIIEEGFSISQLNEIVASMAETAKACNIQIVAGDTKVVPHGKADGIFINTSGIGIIRNNFRPNPSKIEPGDAIIITGTIGDHGCAVMLAREDFKFKTNILSDCAPMVTIVNDLALSGLTINAMRDPTRGGIATTLNELAIQSKTGMLLQEENIPIKDEVTGVCELLGLDPLYLANEGKLIIICPGNNASDILEILKRNEYATNSAIIGCVTEEPAGKLLLQTVTGKRILDMQSLEQTPRIC